MCTYTENRSSLLLMLTELLGAPRSCDRNSSRSREAPFRQSRRNQRDAMEGRSGGRAADFKAPPPPATPASTR